jgi:flagellar protein FliO/FliZ
MRTLHAIFPAAVVGCLLTAPAAFAATGEDTPIGESNEPVKAAQTVGGGSIVRTIVGLAIVLGVIYGLYWVLKQVKASKETGASGSGLETLATLPLGTNRTLHLVRAGDEVVLIGAGEGGVTPIRTYQDAEARELGLLEALPDADDVVARPLPGGLLNRLRSATVLKWRPTPTTPCSCCCSSAASRSCRRCSSRSPASRAS